MEKEGGSPQDVNPYDAKYGQYEPKWEPSPNFNPLRRIRSDDAMVVSNLFQKVALILLS